MTTDDLAARVAERLGWTLENDGTYIYIPSIGGYDRRINHPFSSSCWHCAGLVVEEMERRGFDWNIWNTPSKRKHAAFNSLEIYKTGSGDDAPTAILAAAEAALKGGE